jgi:dihydrofolate synthase/folylpolyglutamate synthase
MRNSTDRSNPHRKMILPQKSDKLLERLSALHPKKIDLSLDRMKVILEVLGHPERTLPPVIHVAGTNGKGSVTAYMRAIFEASGRTVHVYTSPHLVRFSERIRLAGKIIDEDRLLGILLETEELNNNDPITYFEITTAIALKAFSQTPADVVLLEVGLGGRFEATNVVDHPLAAVLTPVSLDHEGFLGKDVGLIGYEKAGIAKKESPLITGKQLPEVMQHIKRSCDECGAHLKTDWSFEKFDDYFIYRDAKGELKLPHPNLNGPHQISNAALAIAALRHQGRFDFTEDDFARAITNVNWPARMQNITNSPMGDILPKDSELWLDGGHNPAAGLVIADHFKNHNDMPLILITGMMSNKDTAGYLTPLAPLIHKLYGIHVKGEDSHSAAAIAQMARSVKINAKECLSATEALKNIMSHHKEAVRVLICGSLYLAGQILEKNNILPD